MNHNGLIGLDRFISCSIRSVRVQIIESTEPQQAQHEYGETLIRPMLAVRRQMGLTSFRSCIDDGIRTHLYRAVKEKEA